MITSSKCIHFFCHESSARTFSHHIRGSHIILPASHCSSKNRQGNGIYIRFLEVIKSSGMTFHYCFPRSLGMLFVSGVDQGLAWPLQWNMDGGMNVILHERRKKSSRPSKCISERPVSWWDKMSLTEPCMEMFILMTVLYSNFDQTFNVMKHLMYCISRTKTIFSLSINNSITSFPTCVFSLIYTCWQF